MTEFIVPEVDEFDIPVFSGRGEFIVPEDDAVIERLSDNGPIMRYKER
jgi:hypothetical protein